MSHEIIIEIGGEELRDRRILRDPRHTGIPGVKRHQRHHAIHKDEHETHQRQRIADPPRNALDQSQQSRQNQLDPDQTKDAPEEHVLAGRAPVDRKPLPRVIPCADAERHLHEPAGEIFERTADHSAGAEDQQPIRLPQMVEQHSDNHHAEAVDRREWPPQEARAVLVFAEQDEMVDGLDHQTEHATDREQPEQIEEIQRNIAFAGQIAAGHTLGSGVLIRAAGVHAPQRELQPALLPQRRVRGDVQGNQHDKLNGRADEVRTKPLQRQRQ